MKRTLTASEAVYGFASWLTTRYDAITISANHDASGIAELCERFVEENKLDAPRNGWEKTLSHPKG